MYITQVATPAVRTGSFRQQMENIIDYKMIDHKMINYKIIDYKIIDHCQSVPGVHLVLGLCFLYLLCSRDFLSTPLTSLPVVSVAAHLFQPSSVPVSR